jgi:hypothetical protein
MIWNAVDALNCFASDQKPRERCVWMKTKPAFPALGAPMSPAWVQHGSPHVEDLALPKPLRSGNFTPAMAVIRWMSANLHQDRSHIGFD